MLTKASAKFIKSLQLKKYRKHEQLFVVEGTKSVQEVLKSDFNIRLIVATKPFIEKNHINNPIEIIEVSEKELTAIGSFKTNDGAIAVVKQKENLAFTLENELILALDDINDPGNLGTIIRIADWYGINKIVASNETVELYNPKVVAASKGSFCRVNMFYTNLGEVLSETKLTKYGAFMNGQSLHKSKLNTQGIIVMGNEANGISKKVEKLIDLKITIPKFGGAESLNVAMATAVICDNFRRAGSI